MKLPEVLTVNEINSILDTIDLTLPEGQRNRAMLEVLYSCGLRVSELTGLRYSDIYPKEGFIRVEGKGSKQRLVPISEVALREIKNYLYDRNSVVVKKGFEDILFLSRRGTALSRIMVFHIIKQQTEAAGIHKNVSPHTFRHSFATHFWKEAPTYALSKRCWGMRKSPPPRYIHISTGNSFAKRYWNIIRGAGQELKRTDPAPLAKPQDIIIYLFPPLTNQYNARPFPSKAHQTAYAELFLDVLPHGLLLDLLLVLLLCLLLILLLILLPVLQISSAQHVILDHNRIQMFVISITFLGRH